MRVIDKSFPFRHFKGGASANPCHCFAKSVNSVKSINALFAKQIDINTASGHFSGVFGTPSENLELSWKGSKVFGIFRKSSDINLISNLEKKKRIT